jgi:hypothetical protein
MKKLKVDYKEVSQYESDIADEMTKILSEELSKEIDKEILRSLGIFERPMRRKNSINKIFNEK